MTSDLDRWAVRARQLAAGAMQNDPGHDLNHLDRVWANARCLLAEDAQADAVVVAVACYLHDVVNLPKDDPERGQASRRSAQQACGLLLAAGFDAARLPAVFHAIEAHSHSAGIAARSPEARIVQDADRLDALGPIGLARMFAIGGALGRALAHGQDPLGLTRERDDSLYTLDHLEIKLAQLPDSMWTSAARALGHRRLAWMRAFARDFAADFAPGATGPGGLS